MVQGRGRKTGIGGFAGLVSWGRSSRARRSPRVSKLFWRLPMKLVKSLLLGSAAGFAAVAGAQAADLPSRKAAPVEYVRVCTAYGAGFFYIPGTDSCLRISGRVRAEYAVGERYSDFQDAYGTRARGRLNIDARTQTAYGTLRTFIRYELTNNTGIYTSGTGPFNVGANVPGLVRGAAGTSSLLD